jgi:hypothetical protein
MRDWHPHDPRLERRLRTEAWALGALQLLGLVIAIVSLLR